VTESFFGLNWNPKNLWINKFDFLFSVINKINEKTEEKYRNQDNLKYKLV